MHAIGKTRILWAILGIAFLLFNPAAGCAGKAMAKCAGHPCCPKPAGTPRGCSTASGCVCMDRQPAAPSLPAPAGGELAAAVAAPAAGLAMEAADRAARFGESPISPPGDLSVQFHQLLL